MATVDRVLPWKRHVAAPATELAPLLTAYRQHHPKAPIGLITRAYEVAAQAHGRRAWHHLGDCSVPDESPELFKHYCRRDDPQHHDWRHAHGRHARPRVQRGPDAHHPA